MKLGFVTGIPVTEFVLMNTIPIDKSISKLVLIEKVRTQIYTHTQGLYTMPLLELMILLVNVPVQWVQPLKIHSQLLHSLAD